MASLERILDPQVTFSDPKYRPKVHTDTFGQRWVRVVRPHINSFYKTVYVLETKQ